MSICRTQRCGVCPGCTSKACGMCMFCKDNPQFGGPGVKKQSCVARRCIRVLEGKLIREVAANRARLGCGICADCRPADCGACFVCLDRRFFNGRFLPGALCAKKKCSKSRLLVRPEPVQDYSSSRSAVFDQFSASSPASCAAESPCHDRIAAQLIDVPKKRPSRNADVSDFKRCRVNCDFSSSNETHGQSPIPPPSFAPSMAPACMVNSQPYISTSRDSFGSTFVAGNCSPAPSSFPSNYNCIARDGAFIFSPNHQKLSSSEISCAVNNGFPLSGTSFSDSQPPLGSVSVLSNDYGQIAGTSPQAVMYRPRQNTSHLPYSAVNCSSSMTSNCIGKAQGNPAPQTVATYQSNPRLPYVVAEPLPPNGDCHHAVVLQQL